MFELRDLERFMAIVEHQNFGRAASALGMTQPALSRRIAALESELGAPLFSRERRQIELTPLGELLVREGRAVLAQASLADHAMREAVRGATGHLRIGTRSMARYRLIPEAVRRLRESHPRVAVTVTDPLLGVQLDLLRHGTVDVTVVRGPVDLEDDLSAARLRSDPIVVALPQAHPLSKRDVVEVAELAQETFVEMAPCSSSGLHDVARGIAVRAGFVPRVTQTLDTPDTLAMCVAAEVGIAFMHDASRELVIPGIVYRPLRPQGSTVDLQAVWRADNRNPVIEPFVHYLVAAAQYEHEPAYAPGPRDAGLFVEHDVEQRAVDVQPAVVVDEAEAAELVHEEAHP